METESFPVVYGEYNASAEKTLLAYMMYDTQPFEVKNGPAHH